MSETTQPAPPPMGVHGGIDFGELQRVAQQAVSDAAKVQAMPSWRVVGGHAAYWILDEAAAPALCAAVAGLLIELDTQFEGELNECPAAVAGRAAIDRALMKVTEERGGTVAVACDAKRAPMLAAAPAMAASLARMVVVLEQDHAAEIAAGHHGDTDCSYCDWLTEARAILAKATEVLP